MTKTPSERKGPDGNGHDRPVRSMRERLEKARHKATPPPPPDRRRSEALGAAMRITVELVAGILVGAGLGWLLDRWLGTLPWMTLLFFMLGTAAGILNVIRAARELQYKDDEANDSDR